MKTAIIYVSQTGFTKRYAEWLSEEVQEEIPTSELADDREE